MKRQSKLYFTLLASAWVSAALMSNDAQAQTFPHPPILACEFEKDCHTCVVKVKWERDEDAETDVDSDSVNDNQGLKKVLTVKCDGETIYDGKAYTASTWIKHDPHFAVSVVSSVKYNKPFFPSVSVDGNIDDRKHGFTDAVARLRFGKNDVWVGKCVHFGLRQDDESSSH